MTNGIAQVPAFLPLQCSAGDPFAVTLTLTDNSDDPLDGVSAPVAFVASYGNEVADLEPVVTNPSTGVYVLTWSTTLTASLGRYLSLSWSFSISIEDVGPYAIVAGPLRATPSTTPGSSVSSQSLSVNAGGTTVNVAVSLG